MSKELTLSIVLYSSSVVRPSELAEVLQIASKYANLRRSRTYFRHVQKLADASCVELTDKPQDRALCKHWYQMRGPDMECMRLDLRLSESIEAVTERFRRLGSLIIDSVSCTGPISRKTDSFFNAAWTFTYRDNSLLRYKIAKTYHYCKDPTIVLNLSWDMVEKMKDKGMFALMCALAEWADARKDIYYGFADVWKSRDTIGGDIFGGGEWGCHTRFLAEQERRWWSHDNDRLRTARGVYLFNYFGPTLTEVLEREPSALDRISSMSADDIGWDPEDYDWCIVKKYKNGSSVVTLTDYYVELCGESNTPPDGNDCLYTQKMHWIYTQLAKLGVIMK